MTLSHFKAVYLARDNNTFSANVCNLADTDLAAATPETDVSVDVAFSTINYKDGLAITNASPVVRKWPMVPGIDAVGCITASAHSRWKRGDMVVVNGWGLGETHWGGLAQHARLKGDWLIPLPKVFSASQAMAIGTAGYTAALGVLALERHGITPTQGEVLVTGATGGVGSIATALLAARGFRVAAATGKVAEASYLQMLGATTVIDRGELSTAGKPLQKERWAAVIDSVGSHTLANACAQTRYGGAVAACGLAQGMDFPASVGPFILRGVTLLGIESVMAPMARREAAWALLTQSLDTGKLDALTHTVPLADSFVIARDILAGKVRGRVVVDVNR